MMIMNSEEQSAFYSGKRAYFDSSVVRPIGSRGAFFDRGYDMACRENDAAGEVLGRVEPLLDSGSE